MKNGRPFQLYLAEVRQTIKDAKNITELKPAAAALKNALTKLQTVTAALLAVAQEGKQEIFLANATLYLEFFGIICVAWQWLVQAVAAQKALHGHPTPVDEQFYKGKICAFRYFYNYELPKIQWLAPVLLNKDGLTVEMKEGDFFDGL